MSKKNFKAIFDGTASYITLTKLEANSNCDIYSTLGEAKRELLIYLRRQRNGLNSCIDNIKSTSLESLDADYEFWNDKTENS